MALIPDAEELVVAALKTQTAVTAITTRIGTRIPDVPVYPLVRVTKVGDFGLDEEGSSRVVVQVDSWADDDATASLLARTIQSCRAGLATITGGGWTAVVVVTTGPVALPDPDTQRARYFLHLELTIGA